VLRRIGDWIAAIFGLAALLSLVAAFGCVVAIRVAPDPDSYHFGLRAALWALGLCLWVVLVS
jgi:hypothetical protein